tara:strand:- start:1307 stop:1591 length:285 start_codon:yes stop_codon:yes gene_type:complete
MGKLTVADAERLQKDGLLDKKTVEQMQEDGLISKGRRNTKRYMKTGDGTWVSPQLYFQGVNGAKYSKKMDEFRAEFNALLEKYATIRNNNTNTK